LGRVLKKGNVKNKQAILYEVVAENTSEERTSERRRGVDKKQPPKRRDGTGNLQVVYGNGGGRSYKAAEKSDGKYKTRKTHKQMNIWDDED
jgi:superfamily II DNA or RNA helicase